MKRFLWGLASPTRLARRTTEPIITQAEAVQVICEALGTLAYTERRLQVAMPLALAGWPLILAKPTVQQRGMARLRLVEAMHSKPLPPAA